MSAKPSQPPFVAKDALEALERVPVQHPHDHWRADRVGQHTHPIESIEYVPTERLGPLELCRYDFQTLLGDRVSIVEAEPVL